MPRQYPTLRWISAVLVIATLPLAGCGNLQILNPAFVNSQDGSIFPLAPMPRTAFVLIRVNNATNTDIEFLVTIERERIDPDNPDRVITEQESYNLFTPAQPRANDLGVLVDCPVQRIGLGTDLDRPLTSAGLFVGAEEVGVGGIGVPAGVNPLDMSVGNFDCGDTVVFQALQVNGTPGGVGVLAYVLNYEDLSEEVTGLDTFANARSFVEDNRIADEDE